MHVDTLGYYSSFYQLTSNLFYLSYLFLSISLPNRLHLVAQLLLRSPNKAIGNKI